MGKEIWRSGDCRRY